MEKINWFLCYYIAMDSKNKFSSTKYQKQNPQKASLIKKAVEQGVKQYALTFKKLAST